jgi:uncharacterized protein (TIGR03437 family)
MKKETIYARYCSSALWTLLLVSGAVAQEPPVILDVQVENSVLYVGDVTDQSRVARSPVPVTPIAQAQLGNFTRNIFLADVTAINGTRAKGVVAVAFQALRLNTAPAVGAAIADVNRQGINEVVYEFLKADGTSYGTIFGLDLVGSGPLAIIGGTGAFLGARGTGTILDANPVQRVTSQAEDPSMRRINGGGRFRSVFQIYPMFRPEVLVGPNGPVIIHSDYSAITSDRPARRGEILILYAKGLGPTTPSVNPGDRYPREPFAVVNSPVEVLVDGRPSPAINQVGLPGSSDVYHVAFRVPDDTAAGTARVQISAAWVTGSAVPIQVR